LHRAARLFSTKLEYCANRARQAHKSTPVVKGDVGKKCDIILVFAFGIDVEDGYISRAPANYFVALEDADTHEIRPVNVKWIRSGDRGALMYGFKAVQIIAVEFH